MINFYPGPSKIYPDVSKYFMEGLSSGLFSMNHRSNAFHELYSSFKNTVKSYFDIPSGYEVSTLSSATEAWEVINQSFSHLDFHHYFNGAFGEKWKDYNSLINNKVSSQLFNFDKVLDPSTIKDKEGVLCLTHNETSNGTFINDSILKKIRHNNPKALIAIDSTSILGGYAFDFTNIDICFSSVQKCLGQPSGMAVIITSEKVKSYLNQTVLHYNDLKSILKNSEKSETTHTPNISGIYNLYRTLQNIKPLNEISEQTLQRKQSIIKIGTESNLSFISSNPEISSPTVISINLSGRSFIEVETAALSKGLIIGKGYGKHKETSFRIANFPAHNSSEINILHSFLKTL